MMRSWLCLVFLCAACDSGSEVLKAKETEPLIEDGCVVAVVGTQVISAAEVKRFAARLSPSPTFEAAALLAINGELARDYVPAATPPDRGDRWRRGYEAFTRVLLRHKSSRDAATKLKEGLRTLARKLNVKQGPCFPKSGWQGYIEPIDLEVKL